MSPGSQDRPGNGTALLLPACYPPQRRKSSPQCQSRSNGTMRRNFGTGRVRKQEGSRPASGSHEGQQPKLPDNHVEGDVFEVEVASLVDPMSGYVDLGIRGLGEERANLSH